MKPLKKSHFSAPCSEVVFREIFVLFSLQCLLLYICSTNQSPFPTFQLSLKHSESCMIHDSGSTVRPKLLKSVHYCPATKKTLERAYTDLTSYNAFPSSNVYPTEDENKNPLETEFGLSVYRDHQTFSIQVILI